MPLKSSRRGRTAPFHALAMMRQALEVEAAGKDVVHLEVGQPGSPAPPAVLAAAQAALDGHRLGYTEALGLPELRRDIAAHYEARYAVTVPIERVVITTGSSAGFVLAFLSAFDAGDRVALATPGYPAYRNILRALDLVPVEIALGPETRFQPTLAHLEALDPLPDGLIIASPANPTGTMLAPDEVSAIARWCHDRSVRLVSDEIYHGISFGRAEASAVAHSDSTIVINSFSKYYAMTGWRLGWMIAPVDLVAAMEALAQNLFLAPPTLPQLAARAALDSREILDGHVRRYRANRDLLLEQLPAAGFDAFAPADGAFYLYADVSLRTDDSMAFCQRMLHEAGVAAAPGIDFDTRCGHHAVRFSFAGSAADMQEAVRRLKAWR